MSQQEAHAYAAYNHTTTIMNKFGIKDRFTDNKLEINDTKLLEKIVDFANNKRYCPVVNGNTITIH